MYVFIAFRLLESQGLSILYSKHQASSQETYSSALNQSTCSSVFVSIMWQAEAEDQYSHSGSVISV